MVQWRIELIVTDEQTLAVGPGVLAFALNGTKWPLGVELQSIAISPIDPIMSTQREAQVNDEPKSS